jgi:cytidylate kinase
MIIAISGKIGSGKDTLSDIIKNDYIKDIEKISFSKKLKHIVAILTNIYPNIKIYNNNNSKIYDYDYDDRDWKNEKSELFNCTIGELLQNIGTNLRESYDKNIWIKALLSNIDNDKNYIISDLRFKNEANMINNKNNILIRINGDPKLIRKTNNSNRNLNHISETDLDNYDKFDYIIENNSSIKNLKYAIQLLIYKYKLQKNDTPIIIYCDKL